MYVQGDLLLVIVAVNPSFFWDTLYIHILAPCFPDLRR